MVVVVVVGWGEPNRESTQLFINKLKVFKMRGCSLGWCRAVLLAAVFLQCPPYLKGAGQDQMGFGVEFYNNY